ncbi:zinc metalloproteinase nas-4-like [Porites lutea]|uniref:zinc metalloproteinase nas-4-like n=1 Tax=Porites lutea TaxID=51062 RepID=UPI003CC636F0
MKLLLVSVLLVAYGAIFVFTKGIKRHLYEGDLLLTAHEYKVLKTRTQGHKRGFTLGRRWPDGPDGPMIPFQLDSDLGKSSKAGDAIEGAMKEWEKKSCVKFVPRSNQRVYITFVQDKRDRCASTNVGYTGRPYSVLLAPRCWWHGMILHELGRGWDFQRQNNSDPSSYATPYDYSSIMHYGDGFASKNDEKTLVPKKSGVTIGHWDSLSEIDIQQINLHYNCPAG